MFWLGVLGQKDRLGLNKHNKMFFTTEDASFVPKKFIVLEFYDEETCFCWDDNKLIIFPYSTQVDRAECLQIFKAPSTINRLHSYNGRVFIICSPFGVYKLKKEKSFVPLSTSAIDVTGSFYKVLVPRNGTLFVDNKQDKSTKLLMKFPEFESNKCHVLPIDVTKMSTRLKKFFKNASRQAALDTCIIAYDKKLYKFSEDQIHLLHDCKDTVTNVQFIMERDSIVGFLLVGSTNNVHMIYTNNDNLIFDKTYLDKRIKTLCAHTSKEYSSTVWIVYSDEFLLYYGKKTSTATGYQILKTICKNFVCLQHYQSDYILGLTKDKQIIKFSLELVEQTIKNDITFVELDSSMIRGSDIIVDKIHTKAKELKVLNENLTIEQDNFKLINLYAYKQKIQCSPQLKVIRNSNQVLLRVDFKHDLPRNTRIVVSVQISKQTIFVNKHVTESETFVELPIPVEKSLISHEISINLIVLPNEGASWCIIKNCIDKVPVNINTKKHLDQRKKYFVSTKLQILEDMIERQQIDMKKLSNIKDSIRREMYE